MHNGASGLIVFEQNEQELLRCCVSAMISEQYLRSIVAPTSTQEQQPDAAMPVMDETNRQFLLQRKQMSRQTSRKRDLFPCIRMVLVRTISDPAAGLQSLHAAKQRSSSQAANSRQPITYGVDGGDPGA